MPGVNSTHTDWKELPFNDMEYANETFDDSEWFTIEFPGNFNDVFGETVVNDFDGVVWIRKSFYLEDLDDAYFLDLGLRVVLGRIAIGRLHQVFQFIQEYTRRRRKVKGTARSKIT